MLSRRTILSLCQYLFLQSDSELRVLFEKHGLDTESLRLMHYLEQSLSDATHEQLHSLLDEIVKTQGYLRSRVSPRYIYDERWDDMVRCLVLDGYRVADQTLVSLDPTIEGVTQLEDDLSVELQQSGLTEAQEIVRTMNNSAEAFRKNPPDYNACLSNARVALQSLATAIAKTRRTTQPGTFDESSWGEVLAYLRTSNLISESDEKGLAGVFRFISPGAHIPVGLTQEEMVRLGRSLAAAMCYFLVKVYNGSRRSTSS